MDGCWALNYQGVENELVRRFRPGPNLFVMLYTRYVVYPGMIYVMQAFALRGSHGERRYSADFFRSVHCNLSPELGQGR